MASTDELLFGLKKKVLYEKFIEDATIQLTSPETYNLNDAVFNYDILLVYFKNNNNYRYCNLVPTNLQQSVIGNSSFIISTMIPGTSTTGSYEKGTHWNQCAMINLSEDGKTLKQSFSAELRMRLGSKTDSGSTNYILRIEKITGLKFI